MVRLLACMVILLSAIARAELTDEDYAQHVAQLNLPHERFTVVVQKPFVVIGDESPRRVKRRAERTVKWAVDLLKRDYFEKDPDHIIDIWLFKDRDSYEKHAEALFDEKPGTPFGYYSPRHRALVMNIATGGGTLVHEIVHPFVRANFPQCPAWFNEGLGTLYEQCGEKDGRIVGHTNWRLAGLRETIKTGELPSFEELCSLPDPAFYEMNSGTNYAQARYLCYYLQEHGLLRTFYHRFRENHEDDPTGYQTLRQVLNEDDMPAFQDRWQRWVLTLRFP